MKTRQHFTMTTLLAFLATGWSGCGDAENSAHIPEERQTEEALAVAPDPHDPEALSMPRVGSPSDSLGVSEGASPSLAEAGSGNLEQRIRAKLAQAEELDMNEEELRAIDIRIEDGVIELSGEVPSREVAESVERRVREMAPSREIDNSLVASR